MADLLLYDGSCGLCSRAVQVVLRRDRRARFHFAPLQARAAGAVLARHGLEAGELDSVRVVVGHGGPEERVLSRSAAVLHVARALGLPWSLLGALRVLPPRWRDALYDRVARSRYRWFGRSDGCLVLRPGERERFFLDAGDPSGA